MLAQEKGVGIVEIELAHIPVRYPALGLALWFLGSGPIPTPDPTVPCGITQQLTQ